MKYTPVFTIELEHDYFSVTNPNALRIVPTPATESVLGGAGLVSKFFQNKLYVLVKHLDSNGPLLSLSNDFTLQFFLEVVGFNFPQITNYTPKDPYHTKLYFSNAKSILENADKSVEDVLYLHEKVPQFNAAEEYLYNALVRSGSNTAYECLQKVAAGTGNLNNGAQFRNLGKVSYVSSNTVLPFCGLEKVIPLLVPNSAVDIKYFAYNIVSGNFDYLIKTTALGPAENPTNIDFTSVLLNFSNSNNEAFAEGIYRVTINAQEEFFYFRPQNDWQPYLGLINIYNDTRVGTDEYRFLKPDGTFYTVPASPSEIETREYKIRFAPAQYLLKYKCRTDKVTDIIDEDNNIEFVDLGGNIYRSKLPVRMNEKPIDTISVEYTDTTTGVQTFTKTKLPGQSVLSLSEDENKYIISETYLNL